jgi:hypothetical protein
MSASETNLFDIASLASWVYSPSPDLTTLPSDDGQWLPLQASNLLNPAKNSLYSFYAEAFHNKKAVCGVG